MTRDAFMSEGVRWTRNPRAVNPTGYMLALPEFSTREEAEEFVREHLERIDHVSVIECPPSLDDLLAAHPLDSHREKRVILADHWSVDQSFVFEEIENDDDPAERLAYWAKQYAGDKNAGYKNAGYSNFRIATRTMSVTYTEET